MHLLRESVIQVYELVYLFLNFSTKFWEGCKIHHEPHHHYGGGVYPSTKNVTNLKKMFTNDVWLI